MTIVNPCPKFGNDSAKWPLEFGRVWLITYHRHYGDVMMSAMTSQITSLSIVCSTVCSGANQLKKSQFRVTGLCERNAPVIDGFPSQGPVRRNIFPFDDVIMVHGNYGMPFRIQAIKSSLTIRHETWDHYGNHAISPVFLGGNHTNSVFNRRLISEGKI